MTFPRLSTLANLDFAMQAIDSVTIPVISRRVQIRTVTPQRAAGYSRPSHCDGYLGIWRATFDSGECGCYLFGQFLRDVCS